MKIFSTTATQKNKFLLQYPNGKPEEEENIRGIIVMLLHHVHLLGVCCCVTALDTINK